MKCKPLHKIISISLTLRKGVGPGGGKGLNADDKDLHGEWRFDKKGQSKSADVDRAWKAAFAVEAQEKSFEVNVLYSSALPPDDNTTLPKIIATRTFL